MAEFQGGEFDSVIDAVLNEGMKLQLALRKHEINLGASRSPKYQRLNRHVKQLKKQKEALASVSVCLLLCIKNLPVY